VNPTQFSPDGLPFPCGGPPAAPPRRRWWIWTGVGCLGFVVLSVVGFGFYLEWAWLVEPATPGRQVPARVIRKIRNLGLIEQGEEIQYLYSGGTFRVEEDLSFFTQRRLVLHCEEWENPTLSVDLRDITSITPTMSESSFDDTSLAVKCEDGTELTVELGSDRGGDKRYYEALKHAWELARSRSSAPPTGGK